ncbi:hypothetical protein ACOYX4_08920 [Enterococcus entomosocium]|uniref:hypothetical protein n=1 Tax=Enterococcus entomosocium TaxID=3034352 RepID=UPI003BE648C8
MNVSATSLSKLISTRKEELARLLEWRGTNFPVVERQNDLRISFIELELEDLEKLNNHPQLNEYQQIAINNAKKSFEKGSDLYDCAIDMMLYDGLTDKEWAKATVAFLLWAQEQEE